jgi:sugar porter (SP) family MFS transporter
MKNRYVTGIALIASLGGLLFGFDTAVISGAEKTIQVIFNLNNFWHGFTVALTLIGTLVGAFCATKPSDKFGRKKVLFAIALIYVISSLGSALANQWISFCIFRFMGGLSVGASSVVGPMYIAEIAPAKIRGRLVGSFQLNIVTGILLSYISNYIIVHLITVDAWRWMFGVQSVPALIFFLLIFIIPDSPRWLVIQNRNSDAKALLARLGSDDPEKELQEVIESVESTGAIKNVKLFTSANRIPIILAMLVAIFNQLSGINAVMYYAPRIFEMVGFAKDSALLQSISVGITLFTFTIVGTILIDKVGRKKLLLIGSVGMAIFLGLVSKTIFTTTNGSMAMILYMVGFIAFFGISQGTVIWVFISEIFPNVVRAKGQTLGSLTHWITSTIISWLFPVILGIGSFGGGYAFALFSIAMVFQFVIVWRFFPETKGKSLEAIQKEFDAKRIKITKPQVKILE